MIRDAIEQEFVKQAVSLSNSNVQLSTHLFSSHNASSNHAWFMFSIFVSQGNW
jgi:hypothetical protein